MKNAYQSPKEITFQQKKDYLLTIVPHSPLYESIASCFHIRELNELLSCHTTFHQLFIAATDHLYQAQTFAQMEADLMIMNSLFHHQDYLRLKEQLGKQLMKKSISLQEYQVLRYVIDFEQIPFSAIIHELWSCYGVEALECAKMCLLEDQYHLAYHYLLKCEDCHDEVVLDLLCSYSMKDYLSLLHHYKKKKRYQLVMSH